jgi:hypothetical protein
VREGVLGDMHDATTSAHGRGDLRLLHDLAVLERLLDVSRTPARERLEQELGADLVRVVNAALAGPPARLAA